MIVIGIFVYFLLGIVWCYIDVEHFETRIDNPLATMIALLIWPLIYLEMLEIGILFMIGLGVIGLWVYLGEKESRQQNKKLLENIKNMEVKDEKEKNISRV